MVVINEFSLHVFQYNEFKTLHQMYFKYLEVIKYIRNFTEIMWSKAFIMRINFSIQRLESKNENLLSPVGFFLNYFIFQSTRHRGKNYKGIVSFVGFYLLFEIQQINTISVQFSCSFINVNQVMPTVVLPLLQCNFRIHNSIYNKKKK